MGSMSSRPCDVVVVGAGPAGLAAALAMRRAGMEAVCVGPPPRQDQPDRRTTALLDGSVHFLQERIGIWSQLASHAEPLCSLRLIDRTGRLFRAPDTAFEASEIGKDAFGYNIANVDLVSVLLEELGDGFLPTSGVTGLTAGEDRTHVLLGEGDSLSARLIVGADGRNSFCRQNARIGARTWSYDQTAVVCNFNHSRAHHNACTEFHYAWGPFTIVPLADGASSLVWVEHRDEAARLRQLSDADFANELTTRLEGLLGDILEVGPRGAFPLSGLIANKLTGERLALVGEAAHVMPPIGAQGLNLGFRDIADLVLCVSQAGDPGSNETLAAYERARRSDVWTRTLAADLLNRTLISNLSLLQILRATGLTTFSLAGPLRRAAMRQGMSAATA